MIRLYTSREDGLGYVENPGTIDGSGGTIQPVVQTREFRLADSGGEYKLDKMYVHHKATQPVTISTFLVVSKTDTEVRTTTPPKVVNTLSRGMTRVSFSGGGEGGEGISANMTVLGNGFFKLNYIVLAS